MSGSSTLSKSVVRNLRGEEGLSKTHSFVALSQLLYKCLRLLLANVDAMEGSRLLAYIFRWTQFAFEL